MKSKNILAVSLTLLVSLGIVCPVHAQKSDGIEIEIVGADTSSAGSAEVLDALQKLMKGLAQKNVEAIGDCLSSEVTLCDTATNNVVYGREAVLEHVRKKVLGADAQAPVKKISIYDPYVTVKPETAMVSFRATKELSGDQPTTLESWCSEVYERKDGQWKILHLQTSWKPLKKSK